MASGDPRLVILDAGPLIHLDELGQLRLLAGFAEILIPSVVWEEVRSHRPLLSLAGVPGAEVLDPAVKSPARLQSLPLLAHLHPGECAALALLLERGEGMLLTDDDAARQSAETLGFAVTGTLGILLRGVRRRQLARSEAVAILRDIRSQSTLHVSRTLIAHCLKALGPDLPPQP